MCLKVISPPLLWWKSELADWFLSTPVLCHLFSPSCWRLRKLIFATSSILILLLLHLFFSLQCRPSKGRRRGFCWCVDKYGQPLPGFDGRERGETQCYNLESKWEDGGMTSGRGEEKGGGKKTEREWERKRAYFALACSFMSKFEGALDVLISGLISVGELGREQGGRGEAQPLRPAKPPVHHSYLSCA